MTRNSHPMFPPVQCDVELSPSMLDTIRCQPWRENKVNPWNRINFTDPSQTTKYINEMVTAIVVSAEPIPGVDPENSRVKMPGLEDIHVALRTDKNREWGVNEVPSRGNGRSRDRDVLVVKDADGLCWSLAPDLKDPPRLLEPTIPALAALDTFGEESSNRVASFAPARLSAFMSGETITSIVSLDQSPSAELEAAQAIVDARLERRHKIAGMVARHFSPEVVNDIFGLAREGGVCPDHSDFETRKAYDAIMDQITLDLLREMRAENMLAPCPNNGPRMVYGLTTWDKWLKGPDTATTPKELGWEMSSLFQSPPAAMIEKSYIRFGLEEVRDLWNERNPGQDYYKQREDLPVALTDEDRMRIAANISRQMAEYLSFETPDYRVDLEIRAEKDNARFEMWDSVFTPVLASRGPDYNQPLAVVPSLEKPEPVRHLTLPVASGRFFVADWPRIDGFNEVVWEGNSRDFNINTRDGKIEEQKHLYEKFGVLKVGVTDGSPYGYPGENGIIRCGDPRESAGITEEPLWRTCTDLWANTYVDMDQLTSILMASGKYGAPEEAVAAIEAYVEETFGASIVEVPAAELNFYVLNGAYGSKHGITKEAKFKELPHDKSWYVSHVISEQPLTLRPKDLVKETWTIGGPLEPKLKEDEAAPEP